MFSSTSPSFLSILECQFIKTQILFLPILPTHISLNVKDAVGTNKHAKPEGPETESEEPKVSEVYLKSMNINKLYQTNLILYLSMTPLVYFVYFCSTIRLLRSIMIFVARIKLHAP